MLEGNFAGGRHKPCERDGASVNMAATNLKVYGSDTWSRSQKAKTGQSILELCLAVFVNF